MARKEIREGVKAALNERILSVFANIDHDPWQFKNIQAAASNTYDIGAAATPFKAAYINGLAVNLAVTPDAGSVLLANASGALKARNAAGGANLVMVHMSAGDVLQLYNGAATLTAAGAFATSSTINGQTISASANFTSTITVATNVTVPLVQSPVGSDLSLRTSSAGVVATFTSATGNLTIFSSTTALQALTTTGITMTAAGAALIATGASTSQKYIELANTGNTGFYFGVEGSSAGGFFTGSQAYESILYSTGNNLRIIQSGGSVLFSAGALTVSAGITATSASLSTAGGPLSINNTTAAGAGNAAITFQRGSVARYYLGFDASDQFILLASNGGSVNLTITDAGAATFRAGITATTAILSAGLTTTSIDASSHVLIATTKKLGLNASGTTYINEPAANQFSLVVGGTTTIFSPAVGCLILASSSGSVGFFGGAGAVKQTVTGSKAANAALTSLLAAMSAYGLVTDSST
jgi:hypothetical protein